MIKINGFYSLIIVLFSISLASCERNHQANKEAPQPITFTVTQSIAKKELFYLGTVEPLKLITLHSPYDGIITKRTFKYGEYVEKDQILMSIISNVLEQEFLSHFSEYVQALDNHSDKERTLKNSTTLAELGYISDNQLRDDKTAFKESKLYLRQARYKMEQTLEKLDLLHILDKKDLSAEHTIEQLLNSDYEAFSIKAPHAGIVISAKDTDQDDEDKKLYDGDAVKQGQALLAIGNLSGIAIHINVSEIDINQIHLKQHASITGDAFPGIELSGYVRSIAGQADENTTGIPQFDVEIVVPEITEEQRKRIHIGMRAKAAIIKETTDAIKIPINAVYENDGKTWVNVVEPHNNLPKAIEIILGDTDMDKVIVVSGLEGDETIVYTD